MTDQESFSAWGLLELFGHQRLAGKLTEQTIGGCHFIRIDVPDVGEVKGYTRLFTQGAIYGVTFTSEDVARRLATNLRAAPIAAFEIEPRQPRLSQGSRDDPGDLDDEDPPL